MQYKKKEKSSVILLKNEFEMLPEHLRKNHKIRIITDSEADFLTEQESEELRIAEAEFEEGMTISFEDVREKWLMGETGICKALRRPLYSYLDIVKLKGHGKP